MTGPRIDVLTIFPTWFDGPFSTSLLGRAIETGIVDVRIHDLRRWGVDRHGSVDDAPYGGGAGMVMRADVVIEAAEAVWNDDVDAPDRDNRNATDVDGSVEPVSSEARVVAGGPRPRTLLFTPRGRPFTQAMARELAQEPRLVLVCGRYEGIDERAHDLVATDEVSIGDYVLFGGEAAAVVVVESVARLVDGVVGNEASPADESFSEGLLEHPHYTRPAVVRGQGVPEILVSGDHAAVDDWRRTQALDLTRRRRPDLLDPEGRTRRAPDDRSG